jgi:hypothetical protein
VDRANNPGLPSRQSTGVGPRHQFGRGDLASTDNNTFLQWLDLADLSAADEMDLDDLCTFAELTAGQRVCESGIAGLTLEDWLSRWRTFRNRHAQREKAVEVFKGRSSTTELVDATRRPAHMTLVEGP